MSIHEHLPPEVKRELKQVGWAKGSTGEGGEEGRAEVRKCNVLHHGRAMRKEEFRREVVEELTGKKEEPSELI